MRIVVCRAQQIERYTVARADVSDKADNALAYGNRKQIEWRQRTTRH